MSHPPYLSENLLHDIAKLLNQQCGLNIELSHTKTRSAIQQRIQVLNIQHDADYLQLLQFNHEELQALIEGVVVPETWFFRYPESFEFLNTTAIQQQNSSMLQILSLPCSTGEEPYSIAISLLQQGLSHHAFHIDAADISHIALQRARAALYYEHSFRHHDVSFRNSYFDALFDTRLKRPYWKVRHDVQQCIHFHHANILRATPTLQEKYDIIFCRNLLIYFDKETQLKTLRRLKNMLKPNGLLFLGHAGSAITYLTENFTSLNHRAFAWKNGVTTSQHGIKPKLAIIPRSTNATPTPFKKKELARPQAHVNIHTQPFAIDLKEIQVLADQGQLNAAKKLCQQYTTLYPTQAEGWFLMGIIMQAEDQLVQAKQHFQKSLYLEPNHQNSLIQLLGIAEHDGQTQQAERLRQRLQQQAML